MESTEIELKNDTLRVIIESLTGSLLSVAEENVAVTTVLEELNAENIKLRDELAKFQAERDEQLAKMMNEINRVSDERNKWRQAAKVAKLEQPQPAKSDIVYRAMQNAANYYNSINGQFNGACFSRALMELAGLEGNIDEKLVHAILAGRDDVEILHGGSHYRIRKQPQSDHMIMRDGGKAWEVFDIRTTKERVVGWEFWDEDIKGWVTCRESCNWMPEYIYRRPLTDAELRKLTQPTGEVLFDGVRWVMPSRAESIAEGDIHKMAIHPEKTNVFCVPVHVTIKKVQQ